MSRHEENAALIRMTEREARVHAIHERDGGTIADARVREQVERKID